MESDCKTKSKKRVAILVTIITLLVLILFVLPSGSGRMTDGEEHEPPTTKTVSGGITVYLFNQKIYDNSYTTEVPIDETR